MVLERTYNVPLRRQWLKVPKYRRAKKAVNGLKEFLRKHMKAASVKDVRIGKHANLELWKHGIRNPPHHIQVKAIKDDKGIVTAELVGAPVEVKKEIKKKTLLDKVKSTITGTEAKQDKKDAAKPEVKTVDAKPKAETAKPAQEKPTVQPIKAPVQDVTPKVKK